MTSHQDEPVVFLLGSRTSHDDFVRFAKACGWILYEDKPSTGPRKPYEQIWVTADRGTAIHYLDDPTPKRRFMVVYGRSTGDVAFDAGANLDIRTSDDVMDRALRVESDEEKADVAWELGVVNKVYDETAFDILKSLYDGADDCVRHAVINAIGYRGWPEARTFLEEAADSDAKPSLRENARAIVTAWWGGETR